jgi:hypothetical protein
MLDVLTKLVPWIQGYPMWLQTAVAAWIVAVALSGGLLFAALVLTPRSSQQHGSQTANPPAANTDSKIPAGPTTIEQQTKGDNSPAVAGVEGDVNITVEQRKNRK